MTTATSHNTSLMTVTTFATSKPTYLATFLPKNERNLLLSAWARECLCVGLYARANETLPTPHLHVSSQLGRAFS